MSQVKKIALLGNPNSGKTTLFNNLTGSHQRVGNWAGVTVERKSGSFRIKEQSFEIVDLPGIYSLEQESQGIDEDIARNFLEHEKIDLIINIIDVSNLERNLVLTNQLLEFQLPMIVVLNMQDVAMAKGIDVDSVQLEKRLGVPVVNTIAATKQGMEHLSRHIQLQLDSETQKLPTDDSQQSSETKTTTTSERILWRYKQVDTLTDGVVSRHQLTDRSDKVDQWVLNKWLGVPIFLAAMYLLFTFAINVGAVFIDFFDILFAAVFVDGSRYLLEAIGSPQLVTTLLSDGVGGGITLVATFIPVIGFLYLGLAIMEDSGYVSRAAFVIDRLMAKIGLPGASFVPLIVGFGCNVPSVMATRSLNHHSERLMTIAMAPFMSCGARLTVYALFATAFFPENGQNIVFLLYLMGIFLAVLTGYIFKKRLFTGELSPSFQEMPVYHRPLLRNILIMTWYRLRGFILRAGKAIVVVVMVLSLLNSLGSDGSFGNEDTENSVLASIGKSITPMFAPIGIHEDNWPATVGLFTGMFAKEAVVGTLDSLYSSPEQSDEPYNLKGAVVEAFQSIGSGLGDLAGSLGDPLGISIGDVTDTNAAIEEQAVSMSTISTMVQQFGGYLSAFSYLVFILLYAPCVAVVGAMVKEANWGWAMVVFSWTTIMAYYCASSIYLIGSITQHMTYSLVFVSIATLIMGLVIYLLPKIVGNTTKERIIPSVTVTS